MACASEPKSKPLGVYLHTPFCRQVCTYCDFNVRRLPLSPPWEALGRAMDQECVARSKAFVGPATSVYFGGGTPSLAPVSFLAQRLDTIAKTLGIAAGAEITLEADPGTVDLEKLKAIHALGVTRLSLGWQSTHEQTLTALGRQHSAREAQQICLLARQAKFDNINLDLIYATPGQTPAQLGEDLRCLLAHHPEHVSLYALTYAPGTQLTRQVKLGRVRPLDDDLEARMTEQIEAALCGFGFEHYEVSNFAQPQRRSKHNQTTWQGAPYLGIGPGAHSFLREGWLSGWRWETQRGVSRYMGRQGEPLIFAAGRPEVGDETTTFVENLSASQMATERVMLGLRQKDGFDCAPLQALLPTLKEQMQVLAERGFVALRGTHAYPTPLGLLHADSAALLALS